MDIKVEKVSKSKIDSIDFGNLGFGKYFTDHMFMCNYSEGKWKNFTIKPFENFSISPASKVFHYGQAVFEGMKAYKDINDNIYLFRPKENYKRLNKSALRLDMPEISEEIFMEGLMQLLRMEKEWIPKDGQKSLYVRPFMIANDNLLSAVSSTEYIFCIIFSPVGEYFSGEVKLKVEDKYSRVAFGGLGMAKAAGNYAASFMPAKKASLEGFSQVIWTDDLNHEYIEEVGAMNIMFRMGDKLVTPPIDNGRILEGVTRDSILVLAKDMGIDVEVRPITVKEIFDSKESKGKLLECFGVGTAAVVSQVKSITYKDKTIEFNNESDYGTKLKEKIIKIQTNLEEDKYGWRVKI